MLPLRLVVAVVRSSSSIVDGVMFSYIIERMCQNKTQSSCFVEFASGGSVGKVCRLRLQAYVRNLTHVIYLAYIKRTLHKII